MEKVRPEVEKKLPRCTNIASAWMRESDHMYSVDDNFTWGKLIGKEVLVDHFFQPMAMLKYGLHKQGVDFNKINAARKPGQRGIVSNISSLEY